MKHLAGVLHKLQVAARKTAKNPVTNIHANKMRKGSLQGTGSWFQYGDQEWLGNAGRVHTT
jgi:hypothetical protein